ncbi:OmpA family protein [Actinomyces vulturis]|uniref:OmpA family protein n=1 Tax=Actinomyces vulturis TaxID=1857645 RepID=UPI00082FB1B7|nr:OmpA family protein [Actinomyces vulturis]
MSRPMLTRRHALSALALSMTFPVLAACEDGDDSTTSSTQHEEESATPEEDSGAIKRNGNEAIPATYLTDASELMVPKAIKVDTKVMNLNVTYAVGPAVTDERGTLVRLAWTVNGAFIKDTWVDYQTNYWLRGRDFNSDGAYTGTDCRLINLGTGKIAESTSSLPEDSADADNVNALAVTFPAMEGDTFAFILPTYGLIENIPVVAAADAGFDVNAAWKAAGFDGKGEVIADMIPFTEAPEGESSSVVDGNRVTINLGSDVFFDVDSSTLSPAAINSLKKLSDSLDQYGGGTMTITGHTDSVGDDAHNQELSVARAQAVADQLGKDTDLNAFNVIIEGKGSSKPAVQETDDASRAANRRVEIVIDANKTPTSAPVIASGTDLPAAPALAAPMGTPLTLKTYHDGTLKFEVLGARRVGKYVVVDYGTTGVTSTGGGAMVYTAFNSTGVRYPTDLSSNTETAAPIALLTAEEREYPLAYMRTSKSHAYATDMLPTLGLRTDEYYRFSSLYTDKDGDELIIDMNQEPNEYTDYVAPFRVTGVKVTG